ncbi:MAG: glutamyl-tRNA reductase [Gammaproteobacteria bacterium RIFCSPHIGHO2_12_FULL_41_15]|nr:MAG: glutamyl-tRNA reductase [Gammaproteobacteria bacterium RIFCSPHIGHO2_12_FULL_41_15]
MTLHVIGINHKTTPVSLRERLAIPAEAMATVLTHLLTHSRLQEAVIISTCNRFEIYTAGESDICLAKWLADLQNINISEIGQHAYHYKDSAAIRHLTRVASGLDSMILGEPQIFGQIKQAFQLSEKAGAIGPCFQQLFPAIFTLCKQIRNETDIGRYPISTAYTVLKIADEKTNLRQSSVLFIGAGDIIRLAAMHFAKAHCQNRIIANRSLENAKKIADAINAKAITIEEIPNVLADCDIIVTATASPLPILKKCMLETAMQLRQNKPMLLLDLAVPRDIEPEAAKINHITLYNIDDLQKSSEKNLIERQRAAIEAEAMIDIEVQKIICELRIADASHIIREFREFVHTIRDEELTDALNALKNGKEPAVIMAALAHNLTNKTLHHPTIKLRQAAYDGHADVLKAAKKLLVKKESQKVN